MIWVLVLMTAGFVVLSGFFAGCETGAYCVNPVRLRVHAAAGRRSSARIQILLKDIPGIIATTLLGTNVSNYLATICMAALLSRAWTDVPDRTVEIYTLVLLTPIVFVFSEMVPKNWFQRQADVLMPRVGLWLVVFHRVFVWLGIVPLLKGFSRHVLRWGRPGMNWPQVIHPRGEFVALLKEGLATGTMSHEQSELIERVLTLAQVSVEKIMVPLSRAIILSERAGRNDVLQTISKHPHSRYPVYRRHNHDIVGIVDAYDFLADPFAEFIAPGVRPTIRIRLQASAAAALRQMREERQTFGLVEDRWGNCVGIVTIKDLVEEIVGELAAW